MSMSATMDERTAKAMGLGEQGHCGECQQRQSPGAVGDVVKTRKNCAEYGASKEATGGRVTGLKDLERGRRDHGT